MPSSAAALALDPSRWPTGDHQHFKLPARMATVLEHETVSEQTNEIDGVVKWEGTCCPRQRARPRKQ
jgi:hypothetical protein